MTPGYGKQIKKKCVPATFVPEVRSKALYTLENAPLQIKLSTSYYDGSDIMGALSHLLNELEAFQTFMTRHFPHRFAFLPDYLLDFARVLLRMFGCHRLRLVRLLLFRLGLGLNINMLTALWL